MTSSLFSEPPLRLHRIQVVNWGTFSQWHDIQVPNKGFLFVGHSGSGKSTLLDLFTVLLAPPGRRDFNAAARAGERGGRNDRSLLTYVRGAWSNTDNAMGEAARQYLRPSSTLSAAALTFSDDDSRHVTLLGVFWINGTGQSDSDVHKLYAAMERPFELGELKGIKPDMRALKKHLAETAPTEKYTIYISRAQSLLGIPTDNALKLLHKAQSAKNLGDLTEFLRQHMLDTPSSFEKKDLLVNGFVDLKECHRTVQQTRKQIETLLPAREAWEKRGALQNERKENDAALAAIPRFIVEREIEIHGIASQQLQANKKHLIVKLKEAEQNLTVQQEELERWIQLERDKGGAELSLWKAQVIELSHESARRKKNRDDLTEHCASLNVNVPDTTEEYSQLQETARAGNQLLEKKRTDAFNEYAQLKNQKKELSDKQVHLQEEIASLERHRSHMPMDLLALRVQIAKAIRCKTGDIPFAGELMQVRSEQAKWRPSIEKLLRPLALTMLVDATRHSAVLRYINANNLRTKLALHHTAEMPRLSRIASRRPLFEKLEFKHHLQTAWLEKHIQTQFDYHCADDIDDYESSLNHSDKAMTLEGLVRYSRSLHIKDDRDGVNDPRRWLLNFDTAERIALLRQDEQTLAAEICELASAKDAILEEDKVHNKRATAIAVVLKTAWEDINLTAVLSRIQGIERQIAEAEEDPELADIVARKSTTATNTSKAREARDQIIGDQAVSEKSLQNTEKALEKAEAKCEAYPPLSETMILYLSELPEWHREPSPNDVRELVDRQQKMEAAFRSKIDAAKQTERDLQTIIEDRLKTCRREWPEEVACTDFTPDLSGADGYFTWLDQLESDKLHTHEDRFFKMLHEQSLQHLVALNTSLNEERKEINRRMKTVNEGLAGKEFNVGTHLRIETRDRTLLEAAELRAIIKTMCEGNIGFDIRDIEARRSAEERFDVLDELIERLRSEEKGQQEWQRLALDVREQVEFVAYEIDASGNKQESYRSDDGKSGGQRQKLTAACLAAALRYQLGGIDHAEPIYTTIVLDEAFANADHDFTRQSMDIFTHFGFQMIVATPFKSVRTLEPYMGAVCVVEILERRQSRPHIIADLSSVRTIVEHEEALER